ncbi:hypothetical protein [Streptomyces sp. NPDC057580]|uniref:hypothetical protein n=1 Tax=Streptomyces sp. NPDC057580 TaxID=3346173 RepID=UPI0036C919CF
MTRPPARRAQPAPNAQAIRPVLLDWRDGIHYRRPAPCVLYEAPTLLRSHAGEAAHKVCAQDWNLAHPGESRFVSDTKPRRRKDDDDHA